MLSLEGIWANRIGVIAANLRFEEREHRELAATAQHVRWDYHGRFLIELIQNAADQAVRAGLSDSSVTVIRTRELIAVLNEGRPLDDEGFRALSSLAVDTKDPATSIGNKGLGFKAVFEVSESPEVFSAPLAGGGLLTSGGYRFAFSSQPFQSEALQRKLAAAAAVFARENPQAVTDIEARYGGMGFEAVLLQEARHSAPFRFPLPRVDADLVRRQADLELGSDELRDIAALVVLPLRADGETQKRVDAAVEEVFGDGDASTVLFLSGVGTLRYIDRRSHEAVTLARQDHALPSPQAREPGCGHVRMRRTSHTAVTASEIEKDDERWWWICTRTLGLADDSDAETAAVESRRILDAVADFPGEHWAKVDRAVVEVAFPAPMPDVPPGTLLGTDGRYCIALPTHMSTGMPVWVNARFHGNIARKEIDIESNAYNRVLFDEAVALVGDLVDHLKGAEELEVRRLATLLLESSAESTLAAGLHYEDGPFDGAAVLCADGRSFAPASEIAIPREADMPMYKQLREAARQTGAGFTLPDDALLERARPLLRQLGASEGPLAGPDLRYLARDDKGDSLLEHAARARRHAGSEFWQPFFEWLVPRYGGTVLADQRVLPTSADELTAPKEGVYAAPVLPETALGGYPEGDPRRLDHVIAARINLFDERCVPVREADGRRFSQAGTALRSTMPPLLREPVFAELVREVFGPRIQELVEAEAGEGDAVDLLSTVAEWALAREARDFPREVLRVPVVDEVGERRWVSPTRIYFGRGWQNDEVDRLLAAAYGASPERLLLPWADFARIASAGDEDREWWVDALKAVGVGANPRVHLHKHPSPPLQASGNRLIRAYGARCPATLLSVQEQWGAYLEAIRQRPSTVASSQPYDVERLLWIDGLEDAAVRSDVVALVLGSADQYEGHLKTRLARAQGYGDATEVPAFWVHALRTTGWPTIPTSQGLIAPSNAWFLVGDERRQRRDKYRFLPCVSEAVEGAQRILAALGVATPAEATPAQYVRALERIAGQLADLEPSDLDDVIALTEEMFRHLQRRLSEGPGDQRLELEGPLPMFDGIDRRRLKAVDVRTVQVILVDDNPVRARFVADARSNPVLPIAPKRGHAALVAALRAEAGEDRVQYTSVAPVELTFTPAPRLDTTMAAFLERAFPGHPMRRDVALLLSAAAATSSDASGDRIRDALERFDMAILRFGTFADDGVSSFLLEEHDEAPMLLVSSELEHVPHLVFAATWELVGAHRDLWANYASALRQGRAAQFLAERGVTSADTREVEAIVEAQGESRLDAAKPLVLALALAARMVADVQEFEEQWATISHSADLSARWVGRPELADALALAGVMEGHERTLLRVLEVTGVSAEEWQTARTLLGMPPHLFEHTREKYLRARETVVAALAVAAAHAVRVDLEDARVAIEQVRELEPSTKLLQSLGSEAESASDVLARARQVVGQSPGELGVLRARLEEATSGRASDALDALLARVATREVEEYRLPEASRSASATRDVEIVLDAAVRLAPLLSETVDAAAIREEGRVAALRMGWWANRFAVLDPLRQALGSGAPETSRRLSEERAFRDPGPPGALVARLRELATRESDVERAAVVPRSVTIASVSLPATEVDADLSRGSDGCIGAEVRRHVPATLDFALLRQLTSPTVPSRAVGGARGRRGGTNRSPAETESDRQLNGLLGEVFVYELLRDRLPGFDFQCWRSSNAVRYGVATECDDGLGADFLYHDVAGTLTGRADGPEVYVEVKATSGEGKTPFELSANEWETALQIHHERGSRAYVIIRISHVRSEPIVHRVFVDPVQLKRDGLLVMEDADLRVFGC